MGKIWFTADTHFNHQRTLELSRRPFKDVAEMNSEMINRWNEVVSPEDTVYHLGDFGDLAFSKLLNGKIILLYGNYEREDASLEGRDLTKEYNFHEVIKLNELYLDLGERGYNLIHEPSNRNEMKFNLFGHIHKLQMVRHYGLNVGVDCHNFKPIDLEEVKFYQDAINFHYDKEVFQ